MVLSNNGKESLEKIRKKAKVLDTKLTPAEFAALNECYYEITHRYVKAGCEKCIAEAYKIINNYVTFYEPHAAIAPVKKAEKGAPADLEKELGPGTEIPFPGRILTLGSLGFEIEEGAQELTFLLKLKTGAMFAITHREIIESTDEEFELVVEEMVEGIRSAAEELGLGLPPVPPTVETIKAPVIDLKVQDNPYAEFGGTQSEFDDLKSKYMANAKSLKHPQLVKLTKYFGYRGNQMNTEKSVSYIENELNPI